MDSTDGTLYDGSKVRRSMPDDCRRLLDRAKSRINRHEPRRQQEVHYSQSSGSADSDSTEAIDVNYIVKYRPKPSVVREYFAAQADFLANDDDGSY
jgi:hypothetical protein